MPITKYGIGLVLGCWGISLVFLVLAIIFRQPVVIIITVLVGVLSVFNLYFFRDPHRVIPDSPDAILSPADGKIIQITEVEESQFFKRKVSRVSIFLSIFNVHVNRIPISGTVDFFRYYKGKFLPAFNNKASLDNEQTAIGIIDSGGRKVMFTQIAGIIARRIVCEVREGHRVKAGERMGMIRYGSRADVYFPGEEVKLRVKVGDKVIGGETVIGVFQ